MLINLLLLLLLLMEIWWQSLAQADMVIKIQEGVSGAIPIAVVPFAEEKSAASSEKISTIISADLNRSGRFTALAEGDMFNYPHQVEEVDFKEWRILGQDALIIGTIQHRNNSYKIKFELIDILKQESMVAYELAAPSVGLRAIAHKIADIAYEKLTGLAGSFSTRIAYITEMSNADGTSKVFLKVSDADGYNQQTIVESNEPLMSPAWSPDGRKIAYVSFENKQQAIFVQDIGAGSRQQVAAYPGINSAPDWSPDGSKLAIVLSKDGDPEIYVLNLIDNKLLRITENIAIDTEPTWHPNGRTLIFTSDRGGTPQLYQVAATGGDPKRLTFKGDYNAAPVFTKDGRSVALVTRSNGKFKIGLLNLNTNSIKELTSGPLDESPSFTSNGNLIVYGSKIESRSELSAVSLDGRIQQSFLKLETENLREPTCSP